jgi:molybdenum-dependent DNA-binding transcriptional regulator ModE
MSTSVRNRRTQILNQVRAMKITVWKAAKTAGITYREMLVLLKTHNVPFPLTSTELKQEIEELNGS